jgi:hypothetical protein
MVRRETGKE